MSRSVPHLNSGLRAVALAALLGGQAACVRSAPVLAPDGSGIARSAAVATSTSARVASTTSEGINKVVVRDYWRAFSSSIVSWNDEEQYQGLRGAILRDGTLAYDHILFYNAYAVPNLQSFSKPEWYAFSDASSAGTQLLNRGMARDVNNCQGKKGCSPYVYFAARVPDAVLRRTRDSLVVRVVSYGGFETNIALRGDLISKYLAAVDSISAARKVNSKMGNQ